MPTRSSFTSADPTLPFCEVEVGGRKLKMCLDFGALASAEADLNAKGANVRLLDMLPHLGVLNNTLTIFACSLQNFQPEITFAEAKALPRDASQVFAIQVELYKLWGDSTPEPKAGSKPENPPAPAA